jgi:hypothetical protein
MKKKTLRSNDETLKEKLKLDKDNEATKNKNRK